MFRRYGSGAIVLARCFRKNNRVDFSGRFLCIPTVPSTSTASPKPRVYNSSDAEFLDASFSDGDNASALFSRVVQALRDDGHVVLLPKNRDQLLNLLEPVRTLIECGIDSDTITDLFVANPSLIQLKVTKNFRSCIKIFSEMQFSASQIAQILALKPQVFDMDSIDLFKLLETIRNVGLKGYRLSKLIVNAPEVLTEMKPIDVRKHVANLKNFFSTDQLIQIINKHPRLFFQNTEELQSKYEYLYIEMGLDGEEIKTSDKWITVPLTYIQTRHEFLSRAGGYIRPDQKRPMLSKDNPKLSDILDSSAHRFAERVAHCTAEEFEVFKEMYSRQLQMNRQETAVDQTPYISPTLLRNRIDRTEEELLDDGQDHSDDNEEDTDSGRVVLNDDDDYGGWKKNKASYSMFSDRKGKPKSRKRKGRM